MLSRREFAGLALAGLPLVKGLAAIDSTFGGIQFGAISTSFRGMSGGNRRSGVAVGVSVGKGVGEAVGLSKGACVAEASAALVGAGVAAPPWQPAKRRAAASRAKGTNRGKEGCLISA